jgi:hypothetical protein
MIKLNKFSTHLKVKILIRKKKSFLKKRKKKYYLESDICQRWYCPKTRRFELHVVDSSNQVCVEKNFL